MAELGLLANLAAVIGAGIQTSIALYSFASTIGSAGRELEDMGSDISLFCRVLRQVQKSLDNPISARLSMTAIQDTQDVVVRCHTILEDIKNSLEKMKGDKQASIDVVGRVKWTFKRPRVLMQRSSLQSCTAYLQIMLSTLDRASMVLAAKQISTPLDSQEEQLDTQMTHGLMLAQQCANRRLEELEDKAASDPMPGDIVDPGPSPGSAPSAPEPRSPQNWKMYRVKRKSIGPSTIATEKALPYLGTVHEKRTSVLINERVFKDSGDSETSKRTPTQKINLHQAVVRSDALLQRWTDRVYSKSPEAPQNSGRTLIGTLQSEPDRASYISWDSQPTSLNMANTELVQAKDLLQEARREQQVSKDEARRAWEELGRREQEERDRATSLRGGARIIVGGIEVVPAHGAKGQTTENVDPETTLLSSDEITRRIDSDQQPGDKSMWVWDNTREEILKVEDQVRGKLPTHDYTSSTTGAPESSQRLADWPISQVRNGSHVKLPQTNQSISPRSKTEISSEKRSTSDTSESAKQRSASNNPVYAGKLASTVATGTGNSQSTSSSFPHAFERWETLSSHWEGLTSFWIRRLEENSVQLKEKPFVEQMARQITDLSAAGANLFHAVVELQRLRASSERKFQRWFSETKLEQEHAQEVQGELERLLQAERGESASALACIATVQADRVKAENLVEAMRRDPLRLENETAKEANAYAGLLWQPPRRLSMVDKPD